MSGIWAWRLIWIESGLAMLGLLSKRAAIVDHDQNKL
jgi:hypothetical protein